jgi:tetratricopeptide (TPR) repeat protein
VKSQLEAAWAAFEREEFSSAESLFRSARYDLETANAARMGLVYVFARTGRFDEARDECRSLQLEAQATGDRQLEYVAWHQLGMVERMAGEFSVALEAERVLIALLEDPPLAVSANAYEQGILRAKLGRVDEARDWLRTALEAGQLSGDAVAEACALRALGEIAANETMRKALLVQSVAAFERAGDEIGALEVRAILEDS